MDSPDIVNRLRSPKAWMAWNDYGKVTISGDPIPAMDHDSRVPELAAQEIVNLRGEACVLASILSDANEVIKTIEAESTDEEDSLWQLRYAIEMALAPYKNSTKKSPQLFDKT